MNSLGGTSLADDKVTEMLITYSVEQFSQARPEMEALLPLHWQELARDRENPKFQLSPDWETYAALEADGQLMMLVVRVDGGMVGYWIGFVRRQLHYVNSLAAATDIYFVMKEYRKSGIGVNLFIEVEKALRARGVDKFYIGCKSAEGLDHSKLFERLGFTHIEHCFARVLND